MGKRREPPPAESAPLWMCTYGDLMSLLLCFFIMLFAISIISEPRFQAMADALQQDFLGYASPSRNNAPSTKVTQAPADSAARSRRIAALVGGQPIPGTQGTSTEVHTILLDGETVRGGVIRFELDSDKLTGQAQRALQNILPILKGSSHKIMIKGYAAPIENQTNNDLAFFRALEVVDYFVSLGMAQEFFEVVVEPTAVPRYTLLPPGTEPEHAGASVEILLLNQTLRSLRP